MAEVTQALREERLGDRVERESVLRPCKSVTLVGVEDEGDGQIFLRHGANDLVGL